MKMGKILRMVACIVTVCIIFASVPVFAASNAVSVGKKIAGTDIPFEYDRYEELNEDLDAVMSKILSYNNSPNSISTYDSEYATLISERDRLLNELDSIGAILDSETLSKLPAPASGLSLEGECELTGNLADLAEYYENWFLFEGYEEYIYYNGKTYHACVVSVRDKGNGLLTNTYGNVEIISQSKAQSAKNFSEIADTAFGVFADELSGLLDLGRVSSWAVSTLFSAVVEGINSGTIVIQDANTLYYEYLVGLETQLYYGYVWDSDTEEWVYCVSSGIVYANENHTLNYYKYNGGTGSQYSWENESCKRNYSIVSVGKSEVCSKAVAAFSNSGDSSPSYKESYQISEIEVKRRWGGKGSFLSLGNDFVFHPVRCIRPGDLWTLG